MLNVLVRLLLKCAHFCYLELALSKVHIETKLEAADVLKLNHKIQSDFLRIPMIICVCNF